MIVRVFRAKVASGDRATIVRFVRDEAIPRALAIPGLLSFHPALLTSGGDLECVLVSTWTEFDALLARQRDLDTAIAMPPNDGLLGPGHADHFELVLGGGRNLPLAGSILRLTRGLLVPGREATYFEAARGLAERLMDEAELAAYHLGRRTVGQHTEALAVSVWADDQAAERAGVVDAVDGSGSDPLAGFFEAGPVREQLEALTVGPASRDAPAILLADDQRRYVYATPRAAQLTGYSLARLLSKRVDDLAAPELREAVTSMWDHFLATGSMDGPFVLARADGSSVATHFRARANLPWPGCHASLLTDSDDAGRLGIDEALVQAGIMSRFLGAA